MRSLVQLDDELQSLLVVHGEKSEAVARVKSLIGLAYYEAEDYDKALLYFDDVSFLCEALGIQYNELGLDNAYRRGKVLELKAGDDPESQAEAKTVLSDVYEHRQQLDDSGPSHHYHQSIEEQFDSTLIYYDQALELASKEKDLRPAILLMEKCLEHRKRKFGNSSVALVTVYVDYADLLRSAERFVEAKAIIGEALEMTTRAYGRSHEKVAEVLNSMGNLYRNMFELDEAEKYLLESLQIRKDLQAMESVHYGATLNNLAEVKRAQNQLLAAIVYHQQALGNLEHSLGVNHPAYINAKGNYGVTLQRFALECAVKGTDFLSNAIDYLHAKAYEAEHPWIQKFGHEQALATARQLAQNNEFSRSIAIYDNLIARRYLHIHSITGVMSNVSPSKPTVSSKKVNTMITGGKMDNQDIAKHIRAGEEAIIHLLEVEKFQVMLKNAEKLINSHLLEESKKQIEVCEKYILPVTPSLTSTAAPSSASPMAEVSASGGHGSVSPPRTPKTPTTSTPIPRTPKTPSAGTGRNGTDRHAQQEMEEQRHWNIINPEASLNELELHLSLQYLKANLLTLQANYSSAQDVLNEAISYAHRRKGRDIVHTIKFRLLLIEIFIEIGRCEDAESLLAQLVEPLNNALAKDVKLQGKASLTTATMFCRCLIADLELNWIAGQIESVQKTMNRLQEMINEHELQLHAIQVSYLTFHARIHMIYGQYDIAYNALDEALNIQNKLTGKEHLRYVDLLLQQGFLVLLVGGHVQCFRNVEECQKLLLRLLASSTTTTLLPPAIPTVGNVVASISMTDSHNSFVQPIQTQSQEVKTRGSLSMSTQWLATQGALLLDDIKHPFLAKLYLLKAKYFFFLHRLTEAGDYVVRSQSLYCQLFSDSPDHYLLTEQSLLLAEIHLDRCEYKECNRLAMYVKEIRKAHRKRSLDSNGEDNSNRYPDYYVLYCDFLNCRIKRRKGLVYDSIQAFEIFFSDVNRWKALFDHPLPGSVCLVEGVAWMEFGQILLQSDRFLDAKGTIAKSGIIFADYFHEHANPYLLQALLTMAEVFILMGKYRDVKVVLSYTYNQLYEIFTYRYTNHPLFIQLYLLAIDNMRAIGYFQDAVEYLDLLKNKISVAYTTLTMESLHYRLLQAKVFKDRNMMNKAEPIFKELESTISLLCGNEGSIVLAHHHVDLAEALIYSEQSAAAEKLLLQALLMIQKVVYNNAMTNPSDVQGYYQTLYTKYDLAHNNLNKLSLSLLEVRILANLNHIKLFSSKPAIIQSTMNNLQNTLLPYCHGIYNLFIGSSDHIFLYFLQGLFAVLSNKIKFNSGRKLLFDALRGLDEFNPYNLPFDHPYVMALGGYEKASSKARLSINIRERALCTWAIHRAEGGEMLPKNMMIDISNHDVNLWGLVYFYGAPILESPDGHDSTMTPKTRGGRGRSSTAESSLGRHSRSPSPPPSGHDESKTNSNAITNDEALLAEQQARQAAEDEIVLLKHQNTDLIEQLTDEKEITIKLTKELSDLTDKHRDMEQAFLLLQEQFKALQVTQESVSKELEAMKYQKQLEEEEKVRKQAELEAKLLQEEAEKANALHPKLVKLLEESDYLIKKANVMITQGYYYEAMPLLEEGCSLRHAILSIRHMSTLQGYVIKANTFIQIGYYECAKGLIQLCLDIVQDDIHSESKRIVNLPEDFLYELQTMLYYIYHREGTLFSRIGEMDGFVKDYGVKIQNLTAGSPSYSSHHIHYGRALAMQANYYCEINKMNEAKAMIERSLALLTKECGSGHWYTLEALRVKANILYTSNKYKECVNLCDQEVMAIKVLIKGHLEEYGSAVSTMQSLNQSTATTSLRDINQAVITLPSSTLGDEILAKSKTEIIPHPCIAQSYLLICKAQLAANHFSEMKNKLQVTKTILYTFYPHHHFLIYEYLFLEAQFLFAIGHYALALEKHLRILREREATVKVNATMTYGNYYTWQHRNNLAINPSVVISQQIDGSGASNSASMVQAAFLESIYAIANAHIRLGHFEKAKEYLNQVIKLNSMKNVIANNSANSNTNINSSNGSGNGNGGSHSSATTTEASPGSSLSLKGNHIYYYYTKALLLFVDMQVGYYENVSVSLENLLDELSSLSMNKENLLFIFTTFFLATAYCHEADYGKAEKSVGKALRYLKNNFREHWLMVEMYLLYATIALQSKNPLKAKEYVDQAKAVNESVYNIAPEHENFAIVKIFEGRVLLEALIQNVDVTTPPAADISAPANVPTDATVAAGEANPASSASDAVPSLADSTAPDANGPPLEGTAPIDNNKSGEKVVVEAAPAEAPMTGNEAAGESEGIGALVVATPAVPNFDNSRFVAVLRVFEDANERYQRSLTLDRSRLGLEGGLAVLHDSGINTAQQDQEGLNSGALQGPPLYVLLKGLLGQIKLLEFTQLQHFIGSLSTAERESYYNRQASLPSSIPRSKKTKKNARLPVSFQQQKAMGGADTGAGGPDPPGYQDLLNAIDDLLNSCHLTKQHHFIGYLQAVLDNLILQFDPLQRTHFHYSKALQAFNQGDYLLASRLLNLCIHSYCQCFGNLQAGQSSLVAEVLQYKAYTIFYLSQSATFATQLFSLSTRIFKLSIKSSSSLNEDGEEEEEDQQQEQEESLLLLRNMLGLSLLFMQDRRYEEALVLHRKMEEALMRSYTSRAEGGGLSQRIDSMESLETVLFLIKLKAYLAQDYLALYRLDEAQAKNKEALAMLQRVNVADLQPILLSTAAGLLNDSDGGIPSSSSSISALRVKNSNAVSLENINALLAELLILVYLNEVRWHDLWGRFAESEDYLAQVDAVLKAWRSNTNTATTTNTTTSSTSGTATFNRKEEEEDKMKAVVEDANPPPVSAATAAGEEGAAPDGASATTGAEGSAAPSTVASRLTASLPPRRTGPPEKQMVPELGRLRQLEAERHLVRAHHLLLLTKHNEVSPSVTQALDIFYSLYNIHYPANWEIYRSQHKAKKTSKKASPGAAGKTDKKDEVDEGVLATDYSWSVEKEEEVNLQCMESLRVLFMNDSIISSTSNPPNNTAAAGTTTTTKNKRDEEEETTDYLSLISTFQHPEEEGGAGGSGGGGGDNNSVSNLSLLEVFDMRNANYRQNQVLQFQEMKIIPHYRIVDCLLLFAKAFLAQRKLREVKECLDVAQKSMNYLLPPPATNDSGNESSSSKRQSLYLLTLQDLIAQYKFWSNRIHDSFTIHSAVLEQRISMLSSSTVVTTTSTSTTATVRHMDLVDSYLSLCQIQMTLNNYEESMLLINQALATARTIFNYHEEHPLIQQLLVYCAEILYYKGYYSDGNMLVDKCIHQLKATVEDLHLSVAHAYEVKGRIFSELCKYEESLHFYTLAKNVYSILLKEGHVSVGRVYYFMALNSKSLNRTLECKQALDSSLLILRQQLGKYHFYTLTVLLEMGVNFKDLGKYGIALSIINRSIHLLKKYLMKDHLLVAYGHYQLGSLYLETKEMEKIMPALNTALYLYRKVLNTDRHVNVVMVLYHLYYMQGLIAGGGSGGGVGAYETAIQSLDNILASLKLIYNTPYHLHIAQATYYLATVFYLQDKIFLAQTYYEKVTEIIQNLFAGTASMMTTNMEHPLLYYLAQAALANIEYRLGRYEQSKVMLERSTSHLKDLLSPQHPLLGRFLRQLGVVYTTMGNYQQGRDLLCEAYSIQYKGLYPSNANHPDLADTLLSLAENCKERGLYDILTKTSLSEKSKKKKKKTSKVLLATSSSEEKKLEGGDEGVMDKALILASASGNEGVVGTESELAMRSSLNAPVLPKDTSSVENLGPSHTLSEAIAAAPVTEGEVVGSGSEGKDMNKLLTMEPNKEEGEEEDVKDDDSVPSVGISVIEMIDTESNVGGGDGGEEASLLKAADPKQAIDTESPEFCAMPLVQRALGMYCDHLGSNTNHPSVFLAKHLLAETMKLLGRFEEALVLHEEIFHLRRKHLGDQHFDTIQSLVSIADTLRAMKRIYGGNKLTTNNAAANTHSKVDTGKDDSDLKDLAKIAGTVTLQEHLRALTSRPLSGQTLRSKKALPTTSSSSISPGRKKNEIMNEQYRLIDAQHLFLTHLEEDGEKKKRKPLPIPKGYMGYAFPHSKDALSRPSTAGDLLSAFNQTQNSRLNINPLHDIKKCVDLSISLLKKVLNRDDPIHATSHSFAKKEINSPMNNSNTNNGKLEVDHPLLALCLFCRSESFRMKGDHGNALKVLEQCLTMRRKLFRSSHVIISDCLHSMGLLLYADQRYLQCIPIFTKVLEMRLQAYRSSSHPAIAEVCGSLCQLYIKLGDFVQAEQAIQQALTICTTTLGSQHPATGNAWMNYAALLQARNQREDALLYYRKALSNKVQVYQEGHLELSRIYNNMAILHRALGHIEEALNFYEKALEIQRKTLGPTHPDLGTTYNNMASCLASLPSRRFEAKELFKQSLSIRIECFGRDHSLVANTMNNYALLLYELQEYKASRSLLSDAYEIRRKIFSDQNFNALHPALAESLANLAFWEYHQGSIAEAVALYEQALEMRKSVFGEKSAIVASTYLQLSAAQLKNRHPAVALDCAEMAYTIRLDLLGELHGDTLAAKQARDYLQEKSNGRGAQEDTAHIQSLLDRMQGSSTFLAKDEGVAAVGIVGQVQPSSSLHVGEEAMET